MGAGVEDALGGLFDGVAVFVADRFASVAGPRVVVVDDGVGVAEATLKRPQVKRMNALCMALVMTPK